MDCFKKKDETPALRLRWVLVALVAGTFALYWPTAKHEFLNYDDDIYVTNNDHVRHGITASGLAWAFGRIQGESTYWHPLTWLSHMVDVELFGMNPAGHHMVNVGFHAISAALLFLILSRITGSVWRSASVAALFAWHPLQVDTVAWVAERKNVLSTVFWMLTVWAYVRFAELKTQALRAKNRWYALSLACFGLGLMAKFTLVTLPFVLLLLDFWPLKRFRGFIFPAAGSQLEGGASDKIKVDVTSLAIDARRLVVEKLPFFVLTMVSCAITYLAHHRLGIVMSGQDYSLGARLANAVVSYARYIRKTVWPDDLAVLYPHPGFWPLLAVVASVLLLTGLTALVVWRWRRQPYLAVGWFWFLGILVPVIGLVQAGIQSMADRFVYVAIIGFFIALVWAVADLLRKTGARKILSVVLLVGGLGASMIMTSFQLRHWQDSEHLFRRALMVTQNNYLAHNNLGLALLRRGEMESARHHFMEAIRINPFDPDAHFNLGVLAEREDNLDEAVLWYQKMAGFGYKLEQPLFRLGQIAQRQEKADEAFQYFAGAAKVKPSWAEPFNSLGMMLQRRGQQAEAIQHYQRALQLDADFAEAHNNCGVALASLGRWDEAGWHFREAVRAAPENSQAHSNLGLTLVQKGQFAMAKAHYQEAIRLDPENADAHFNLGLVLVRENKYLPALPHLEKAVSRNPENAQALKELGLALMEAGRSEEARPRLQAALKLQPNYPQAHLAMGRLLASLGERELAVDHFRRAIALMPDLTEAQEQLEAIIGKRTEHPSEP